MDADTLDLKDIFRKDTRYVVPTFQRPYVWEEEEHWMLLWEDLRQVVEELLERRSDESGAPDETPEMATSPHFLGAIVLDQLANPTKKLETREVVDGQQRLITLQVLLSAAKTVAEEHDLSDRSSMFEKLIYNDEDIIDDGDHRLKVWPIEPDQDAFRSVMDVASGDGSGKHRILDCYQFFLDTLSEWCADGDSSVEEELDALETTVWGLIRLVVIDLESNDDAQVIFETLNARGTPLLAADLIKNFLFREATRTHRPSEELHEEYWKQFDEEEWREEVVQGRLERPRIDVFIMHWLTMSTARLVRAKKLFPAFQKYLKSSGITVEEILQDINHYADVYRRFSGEFDDDREGAFFRRLDVMDTTTPLPVLLWMFGNVATPADRRKKAVEAIESWLIRRMLCRVTTKNYNKLFLDLLEELKAGDPIEVDKITIEFFSSKKGNSEFWPDDETLAKSMVELPYWNRINQRRLGMVFRAMEREVRDTGYSECLEITGNLHIEHILPREWAHHWPLPGERPEEVERIERDRFKHTMGNLTVLTDKLNPALSNASWETKREAIDEHSVILLNRELVRSWPDRWDEETIAERGESLTEIAADVWPGPDSSYWD